MGNHRKVVIVVLLVAAGVLAAGCVPADERSDSAATGATTAVADAEVGSAVQDDADADADADVDVDVDVDVEEDADAEDKIGAEASAHPDATIRTMLEQLGVVYRAADGVWPGFDPNDHPAVIALRNGSAVTGAVAINHPDADALGNAVKIDAGDAPFTAHHVTELAEPAALERVQFFEFNSIQGGVDSFVIVADPSDAILAPKSPEFATTYLHEMFHRYQFANFNEAYYQDFENYPYTAENLELAALEGRALTEALRAETETERDTAAARFAAVRMARRAAAPEVAKLDDSQEISEGTARYIEHRVATEDFGAAYHRGNVDSGEIPTEVTAEFGVKETFGFGRFYATGAAIVDLLDQMAVPNFTDRIEANESPATILADALGVTEADVADLVAEAKATYDPRQELAAQAEAGAALALDEPPIFDDGPIDADDTGVVDGDGDTDGDGETIEITDEQLECLIERGLDVEDEQTPISDEDFAACVG